MMCEDAVLSLACSPDSDFIAAGCRDGSIKVRVSPQIAACFRRLICRTYDRFGTYAPERQLWTL
jgi:hypothetical protein